MALNTQSDDVKKVIESGIHWSDTFETAALFIEALSNFAWPALFLSILLLQRQRLGDLVLALIQRVKAATEIEFGGIKLKGVVITKKGEVIKNENDTVKIEPATKSDLDNRYLVYKQTNHLMLVHTIRPAEPEEKIHGLRVFDVSIYLASHRNEGQLNSVKRVSYYLGKVWGQDFEKCAEFGAKYIVDSGNDCFALTASMYGACVCMATIEFHDKTPDVTVYRYLDVEMAPVYGVPLADARVGQT